MTAPTPSQQPLAATTTLAEAGEFGLLAQVLPNLPTSPAVRLGPGDDAAVVALAGDAVVSTDTLVEGVHFRRDWASAGEIGHRAVGGNVADLEAMGARPVAMVIALSCPGDVTVGWVRELMAGILAEADAGGITLVGGDVTRSRDVTIAVTVIGQTEGVAPVTRSGARPGDVVALCGRTGWAAAGLAALSRGFRSPRVVVDAYRRPVVPYGQGRAAALGGATAMVDVSDGLLSDLGHIAAASGVAIDVHTGAFEIDDPLRNVAAATGKDPLIFVLTGGEDHALAATFPTSALPEGWRVVGTVGAGSGVTVDGAPWVGATGWDHFVR